LERVMAGKTREEAEKTRVSILDAAFEVFTRKGFVRTTLNDIASTAGVTRGAIYWHFKDKFELFKTLWEEIEAEAAVRPKDLPVIEVQSLEHIKDRALLYLSHFENNSRYAVFYEMLLYKTEHTRDLEPVLTQEREKHREIRSQLMDIFTNLKERGLVRSDLDPAHAALALVAFIVGLIEVWLFDRTSFSLMETAPSLLTSFLSCMKPEN
jgi:TetR/AcrR family transcriptional regulator, acrAB operon repressor